MSVYDRQVAQATRMIQQKGELVTWVKQAVTRDSSKPWKTTSVDPETTFPVSIVFVSQGSNVGEALQRLMTGTSVQTGGPKGLMAQVPFTPELNDTVLRGTTTLVVSAIDVVEPNGEKILYKIFFA